MAHSAEIPVPITPSRKPQGLYDQDLQTTSSFMRAGFPKAGYHYRTPEQYRDAQRAVDAGLTYDEYLRQGGQ